ncbi:MAG: 50S ribosomal protein L19 [Verrucomicrobiota bacterium]|nr:50S ribosomal protein L19 [Verrucomicrobiota bacterium]
MVTDIITKIEREQINKNIHEFNVGDSIKVHCRVVEGGKERIQMFEGICIARRGSLVNESFTVRKISSGEGVERTFPLHTPKIAKIEIAKKGKVRRARLNYLRDRLGKSATNLKEPEGKVKGSTVGAGVAAAKAILEAEEEQAKALEDSTEEAPAEEVPAEEAPAEEAPAEEAPAEEAPAEEAPAEEAPAEEAPAEEAPAEEAPAEEAPTEEAPTEEEKKD